MKQRQPLIDWLTGSNGYSPDNAGLDTSRCIRHNTPIQPINMGHVNFHAHGYCSAVRSHHRARQRRNEQNKKPKKFPTAASLLVIIITLPAAQYFPAISVDINCSSRIDVQKNHIRVPMQAAS